MKKISFLSLLLFWPVLCLGGEGGCASSSRTLLSKEDFAYIAGDMISEGRIVYSPLAQYYMDEHRVSKTDLEYTLRYPAKILPREDSNEYNIIGLPNRDESLLRLRVFLDGQGKGQLLVSMVKRLFPEDRIPLSRADFIPFISDSIAQRRLVYSAHTQKRMKEHEISRNDIEYVLKNPKQVGSKNTQNYGLGDTVYIMGEGADKTQLQIGLSLVEKGRIFVTSAVRTLEDQIPLLREDFMHFMRNYTGAGKKIVYTQFTRNYMNKLVLTERDMKHILEYPIKIEKKAGRDGYHVIGRSTNGEKLLRVLIIFDSNEEIVVLAVDTPFSTR